MNDVVEKARALVEEGCTEIEFDGDCIECGEWLHITINLDVPDWIVGWTSEHDCGIEEDVSITRDELLNLTDDLIKEKLHLDPTKQITV